MAQSRGDVRIRPERDAHGHAIGSQIKTAQRRDVVREREARGEADREADETRESSSGHGSSSGYQDWTIHRSTS